MFKIHPKMIGKKFLYKFLTLEIQEDGLKFYSESNPDMGSKYLFENLQYVVGYPGYDFTYIGDYDHKGNSRDLPEIIGSYIGVRSLDEMFEDESGIKYHYALLGQLISDNLTYLK